MEKHKWTLKSGLFFGIYTSHSSIFCSVRSRKEKKKSKHVYFFFERLPTFFFSFLPHTPQMMALLRSCLAGFIVKTLFITTTIREACTAVRFNFLKTCWAFSGISLARACTCPVSLGGEWSVGWFVCLSVSPLLTAA